MSNLSELLNPVPSSSPAPGSSLPQAWPLKIDTAGNPSEDHPFPKSCLPVDSPTRRAIPESSIVEALANAITDSATLYSPPRPTMTSLPPLGPGFQDTPPLRPPSGRVSPPLPLDISRQPERPLGAFSPGLEQYHHASSDEVRARRLSGVADEASQKLAPLRRSLSDENTRTPIPQLEPTHHDSNLWGHGKAFANSVHASSEIPQEKPNQDLDQSREAQAASDIQPETTKLQEVMPPTMNGLDKVQVKMELMDPLSVVLQRSPEDGAGKIPCDNTSSDMDGALRKPPSRADADVKPDVIDQPVTMEPHDSALSATANPKPSANKKRAAPKSKVEKKGTASTVKPPPKRRKVEPDSASGTPPAHRSGTPASSRASKTPAPRNRKRNSVTPARSSSNAVVNETEEEDEDAELFCICRKPDDHTWMIACDGPCEDWFHGRCVEMNEKDGNLIDKYICPNCHANGVGQTTWKPMCRLESCRDPARVAGPKPSKYCSEEHGLEYFRNHAIKQDQDAHASGASMRRKRRRKDNYTDHFGNGEVEDMVEPVDDRSHLRGGILRSGELKALVDGVKDISEFRKLGDGVLSPPRTASPDADGDPASSNITISYSAEETNQLKEITAKKDALKQRKTMLDHRDRFLTLVRARAKKVLEHLRKKEPVKDICGFDARLSWSDEEFQAWCGSPEGSQSLANGTLSGPSVAAASKADKSSDSIPQLDGEREGDSTGAVGGGGPGGGEDEEEEELGRGVCQKRRCERHKTWWKLQQQDVAFERDEVRQALGRLEAEEKSVRKRALVRGLEHDREAEVELDAEVGDDNDDHDDQTNRNDAMDMNGG